MPEVPWEQPPIDTRGPGAWCSKKRPILPSTPTYEQRIGQLKFDMLFAGAKSFRHWEDEWPLMSEDEFDGALRRVAMLEFGGQSPDGKHPRDFLAVE